MLFVFFFINFLFVYFFYFIDFFYLSFLPLLVIFIMIFKSLDSSSLKNVGKEKIFWVLRENFFAVAWGLVLIGFLGMFSYAVSIWIVPSFMWDSLIFWISLIFIANLLLFILSYSLDYKEGKRIFHFGVFLSIIGFFVRFFMLWETEEFFRLFVLFWSFLSWFYAFLFFIVWVFKEDARNIWYLLYLFWTVLVILSFYIIFEISLALWFLLGLITLSLLFLFQYTVKKLLLRYRQKKIEEKERREELIESILEWKKYEPQNYSRIHDFFDSLNYFFENIPLWVKFFMSLLNIFFILFQIYFFFESIWSPVREVSVEGVYYWLSILFFIINFLLLKFIEYPYKVNRVFVFLILNFGVYLSIINGFWKEFFFLALLGVLWNFFNSFFIFFSRFLFNRYILGVKDYYFWIFFNFVAMFVNLYFVSQLDYNYKFLVSVMVFYIWVQLFLFLYNIGFVRKLKEESVAFA